MRGIRKDAMARLRRAVESTDPEVETFVESLGVAIMETMSEADALRFERLLTLMAQAAEELGYDATPEMIRDRARELARRPN